ILVPRHLAFEGDQRLVRKTERNVADDRIEVRLAGIPAVLVTEGAATGINWRMPGRIHQAIGPDGLIGVVLALGASVELARLPLAERMGIPGCRRRRRQGICRRHGGVWIWARLLGIGLRVRLRRYHRGIGIGWKLWAIGSRIELRGAG